MNTGCVKIYKKAPDFDPYTGDFIPEHKRDTDQQLFRGTHRIIGTLARKGAHSSTLLIPSHTAGALSEASAISYFPPFEVASSTRLM